MRRKARLTGKPYFSPMNSVSTLIFMIYGLLDYVEGSIEIKPSKKSIIMVETKMKWVERADAARFALSRKKYQ